MNHKHPYLDSYVVDFVIGSVDTLTSRKVVFDTRLDTEFMPGNDFSLLYTILGSHYRVQQRELEAIFSHHFDTARVIWEATNIVMTAQDMLKNLITDIGIRDEKCVVFKVLHNAGLATLEMVKNLEALMPLFDHDSAPATNAVMLRQGIVTFVSVRR